MTHVYLLKKHPRQMFSGSYMLAAEVVGVYASAKEPKRIAKEKNDRRPDYLWTVQRKEVKA